MFAAEVLFDRVVERFEAEGNETVQLFGWRKPAKHKVTTSRIVWVPGDHGNAGAHRPARDPGGNPRSVGVLEELFTIEIASVDSSDLRDERLQYRAVRELHDAWFVAMHQAAYGTFRVVSSEWTNDRTEIVHGAEMVVVVAIDTPIFDRCALTVPVDVRAEINVQLNGVEATVQTAEAP